MGKCADFEEQGSRAKLRQLQRNKADEVLGKSRGSWTRREHLRTAGWFHDKEEDYRCSISFEDADGEELDC